MSNAASIQTAALSRLSTLLGATYKEHTDIFDYTNVGAVHLTQGYSVVLLKAEERDNQGNFILMRRDMRTVVTHRTYAAADATKVKTTLTTVYDKEKAIIDSFRTWQDKAIGLIACLPTTNTEIEQSADGEDSFIVNTMNFSILYVN